MRLARRADRQNLTIGGHPAWATEIDLTTWTIRPLDIITNSFCAGGSVSGNGSLVNVYVRLGVATLITAAAATTRSRRTRALRALY